ncbi:LysR family transcriptional regulator [Achromobacter sp. Marseille-Q0513]|uniref:LysR family transcriptional regulator n=1 Tax=Achromobacter sp. Marseille-Q0513 TaxID=2829161 RepID=UPI001B91B845|nr:LysR family transcriptional regulator [Achromobacter sp. Marseille-Q0513]MBR8652033.1 LysR family transcriptional regulator [Achromobacter sp. Marseille-Q0513]
MNIRFLETMIWLSELKNFRATAERMNMTPAAISNRIAVMEQELGIRLFERDVREVRLTHEGMLFVEGARDIVARYGGLLTAVRPAATVEDTVRIGLVPSMAFTLLAGIMELLRSKFPHIRVALTTDTSGPLAERLERRELDLVLGLPGPRRELYRVLDLCTFGMFWIAHGAMEVSEQTLGKDDLLSHPIISYEIGMYNHGRLVEYLSESGFERSLVHYSNSLATTVCMITAGIGIAVLPPIVLQNELRNGTLRVLNVKPAFPPTSYCAYYLESPSSRLAPLIASIAYEVATQFCSLYDDALVCQQESAVDLGPLA